MARSKILTNPKSGFPWLLQPSPASLPTTYSHYPAAPPPIPAHNPARPARLRFAPALLLFSLTLAEAAPAASGGPDLFGYTYRDSAEPSGPTHQWIEISGTGQKVIGRAVGGGLPTEVATVDIDPAHMFYGIASPFLRISRHGYISNDGTDPGNDFTNDCPIDTPPSSGGGSRHVVFHDRIEGGLGSWGVYHQFFPTSPHPHHSGRVHVVQWQQVQLVADGTNTPFSFQALLFGNGDVIYRVPQHPSRRRQRHGWDRLLVRTGPRRTRIQLQRQRGVHRGGQRRALRAAHPGGGRG